MLVRLIPRIFQFSNFLLAQYNIYKIEYARRNLLPEYYFLFGRRLLSTVQIFNNNDLPYLHILDQLRQIF